jgi:hypothetical protein
MQHCRETGGVLRKERSMGIDLDEATRATLQRALKHAFPDAEVRPDDEDAAALALHRRIATRGPDGLPPELARLDFRNSAQQLDELAELTGANAPDGLTPVERAADDVTRYYWIEAVHTRKRPADYTPFTGRLAMARATLPDSRPETFRTALGTIEPGDHLISTVNEANQKFAHKLDAPLTRVDVVTPLRQGLRFGALSVYLGYQDAAGTPSCYILEAGTATGQPKVLFFGKTLDTTIDQISGYKPTPFSCQDNAYNGRLLLEGDSPKQLHIKARQIIQNVSQPHYMDVMLSFSEQTGTLRNVWAGVVLAEAALIVWLRQQRGLADGCVKLEANT